MYYDEDKKQIGMFCEIDCAVLTKCVRTGENMTRTQKAGNGLGRFYKILGVYEGFDPELNKECQVESLWDTWERYWDFYEMIIDYYNKCPDLSIKIVKKTKTNDDDWGKQPAQEGDDD